MNGSVSTDASGVTVLADGAKWIWEEQRKHLTHAEGVLGVFHAVEHVAATNGPPTGKASTPETEISYCTRSAH